MEDDEEMEMEMELVFEAREVDLDYEFDAVTFFDFTREESFAEAREAEKWFDAAKSYPPSPFVAKLVMTEETEINASPKAKSAVAMGEILMTEGDDDDMRPNLRGMDQVENCNNNAGAQSISRKKTNCGVLAIHDILKKNSARHGNIIKSCAYMGKHSSLSECEGVYTNLGSGNMLKISEQLLGKATGFTFSNQLTSAKSKAKMKSNARSAFPRSSTLMKPTASQLARQNWQPQTGGSRFPMLLAQREKNSCNSSVVESQAAKRQKLEGGHLCKAGDAKQQPDFIHKAPRKDGTVDKGTAVAKLRLTIPREPDLETAHRAQRMRPKSSTEVEHETITVRRFKARPLNRKILEAPSLPLPKKSTPKLPEFQEFHLKTSERAMHHTPSVFSSSLQCNDSDMGLDKPSTIHKAENQKREFKRPSTIDALTQDKCGTTHVFKAHPLNKKIFSSKGDIGVFRNSKRETTVPVGFNFQTDKRLHQNLPIDLFSKLSLKSEPRPNNALQLRLPRQSCVSTKGSKENRLNSLRMERKMTYLVNERLPSFGGNHSQCGNSGCMNDIGNRLDVRP